MWYRKWRGFDPFSLIWLKSWKWLFITIDQMHHCRIWPWVEGSSTDIKRFKISIYQNIIYFLLKYIELFEKLVLSSWALALEICLRSTLQCESCFEQSNFGILLEKLVNWFCAIFCSKILAELFQTLFPTIGIWPWVEGSSTDTWADEISSTLPLWFKDGRTVSLLKQNSHHGSKMAEQFHF